MIDRFSGIVPVLVTPLKYTGELDEIGLTNLVRYYLEENVSGLWVLGTGGEDMGLTFSQRIRVAEIVSELAGDKIKLAIGTSFYSLAESLEFLELTKTLKFSAYHAMPYHPKVSSNQILTWYKHLADAASKPLWVYTSGNWAQNINPRMVAKLKHHPNIEGVKFSTSNAIDLQEVSYLNDQNFQVISAVIKSYFYSLALGLEAATSVEATCFIKEIRNVEEAYKKSDLDGARKAQKQLIEKLSYPSPAAEDNFLRVAELKYMLSKKVEFEPFMSGYYRNLTASEAKQLDKYIASL